jgi:geranyl-CoA carboxylase alpha subunit
VALGVRTNQEFLSRCLSHRVFAAGEATTAFIGQYEADLVPADEKAAERAAVVGAWLLHETGGHARHRTHGRRLAHALPLGMHFALDSEKIVVSICQAQPQLFKITLKGKEHALESVSISENDARFILDGVMESVAYDRDDASLWLRLAGRPHELEDHTRTAASRKDEGGGDGRVRASMNGRVVAILAGVGDRVLPGQPLLTLEAMKMEHIHNAPVQGIITAMLVAIDQQVQAKRVVVEILPDETQGAAR